MTSLRDREIVSLKRMLNFNTDVNDRDAGSSQDRWKVLLYDDFCRDVISLLLNVGDLRSLGVTLHMPLSSDRSPVADIPAVYFCKPNEENIGTICKDLEKNQYDTYYLNFSPCLPSEQLEYLAKKTAELKCENQIAKIWDQYLSFVCLENDMFSLHRPRSFAELHDPILSDSVLEATVREITDSMFGVLATMGVVPVIRAPRGGPAEMIAKRIDEKLRMYLKERVNPFAEHGRTNFQRPVLVLLDRTIDLSVMLHHTWTYQALTHDVMSLRLNRVTVENAAEESSADGGRMKTYDLNPTDTFWHANSGSPFPHVAEEVENCVAEYTAEYELLTRNAGTIGAAASSFSMPETPETPGTATQQLASAISALPLLTQKKKMIDLHVSLATALLNQIRDRQLDNYFSTEENMISRGIVDVSMVVDLIKDSERGTSDDKLRLALITALCAPNIAAEDRRTIGLALQDNGCDKAAWDYVLSQSSLATAPTTQATQLNPARSTSYHSRMDKISSGILSFADKAYSKGLTGIISGMKQLLPSSKDLPITRIVDMLMDLKTAPETSSYLYFDPKLNAEAAIDSTRSRIPFKSALVFVVGGGNYVEYHNLKQMAKAKGRTVTYGATEITSPSEFLSELSFLGKA